jgi:VanZ family protein
MGLRFMVAVAVAVSGMVIAVILSANQYFGPRQAPISQAVALGLLVVGWIWIARLLRGSRDI